MFTLNVGLFFLSIPVPGFVPSDRFAWNGPAPMVFRHKTLHLTLTRLGKGRIGLWIIGLLYRKIFFR